MYIKKLCTIVTTLNLQVLKTGNTNVISTILTYELIVILYSYCIITILLTPDYNNT